MILHIEDAKVIGATILRVRFNDNLEKTVDLKPLLEGPVFEPLQDADYFAQVEVDPVCKTVVWPNGADFAPEALHALPEVGQGVAIPKAAQS
jgi:hypothetical protein